VIKGYEHYREGTCVLFDDAEIARWNQQWDANMIRQEALVAQQQFWPADEVLQPCRCKGSQVHAHAHLRHLLLLTDARHMRVTGGWHPASGAQAPLPDVRRRQREDAEQQPHRL
jgi:hypothetical protein